MNIGKNVEETKVDLQIAPLIDVVFLLLIYFMVTTALIKKEGDMSFMLPATVQPDKPINLPVEGLIFISAEGAVELEGIRYSAGDKELKGLISQLAGMRELAKSQNSPFFVNLVPNKQTRHRRIIEVMDACAAAGVKNLGFSEAQ